MSRAKTRFKCSQATEFHRQLEAKITEAKAKKDQLKARAQTAKVRARQRMLSIRGRNGSLATLTRAPPAQVSTKINDMLSKTSTSGALEAFDRMEDKIEKMEAEAEVPKSLPLPTGFN